MDPLQASPITNRPDLDADGAVGWAPPGGDGRPPTVVVNTPSPPPWWRAKAGVAWQASSLREAVPVAHPPAWQAPAAELGRLLGRLVGGEPRGPEYPPLRGDVRTYSPFGG